MAHLQPNVRYRGSFVSITDVCCRLSTCRLSDEEQSATPEVIFPGTGVFVRHMGAEEVVTDANQVLFFNANEGYRVSHPKLDGDDCTSFVFSASVVADAIAVHHRVIRADLERPYRLSHGLLGLRTIVRQHWLRQRLSNTSPSALEIDELALQLLNDVLTDADGQQNASQRQRADLD